MQAVDPESLEKENDRDIAALGDRVGMLRNVSGTRSFCWRRLSGRPSSLRCEPRQIPNTCFPPQITSGIHAEVEEHHTVLDNMVRNDKRPHIGTVMC